MASCKMVLVLRTDLGMTAGKLVAQAAHAALASYQIAQRASQGSNVQVFLQLWEAQGTPKIALGCGGEEELLTLHAQALSLDLPASIIQDAGRTQVDPGTITALAIGPGPSIKS